MASEAAGAAGQTGGAVLAASNPWLYAGSQVLGALAGSGGLGGASPGGPSDAVMRNSYSNDFGGFNVNYGSGSIDTKRTQAGAIDWKLWAGLAVAGLFALKIWKKH